MSLDPGTIEYDRIGNVLDEPVIDEQALARVSIIRTDQLRAPDGFDCATCFARVACLGGCHCQYVGQDGVDPRNRFDIARAIQRTCRGGPPWPPCNDAHAGRGVDRSPSRDGGMVRCGGDGSTLLDG